MLYTSTVDANTLSILKQLLALPVLQNYSLVGGTALSLQYGHRISVDLDLFSNAEFEYEQIINILQENFGSRLQYDGSFSRFGIFCFIDDIKVDIIHYPHKNIAPLDIRDDIRMYSIADISAMKIQAILGRGKKKDFWDIAELLSHFSVEELINYNNQKYPNQMLLISIPQALTYFEDANDSEEPISLKGQTWDSVQAIIKQKVREYLS